MILPTIKDATDRLRFLNLPRRSARGVDIVLYERLSKNK